MTNLARLALATHPEGPDPSTAGLAMLVGLTRRRWRVQHFRSRACPTGSEIVGLLTGRPGRHLDSWLMPGPVCREVFARGARHSDLAIVEGSMVPLRSSYEGACQERPGRLEKIAEALELPVVALVTCRSWQDFHMPRLPDRVDAVLLDGIEDPEDYDRFRRMVGLTLRKPVLGGVEALPEVREALRHVSRISPPPEELTERLASSFLRFADLDAIRSLAQGRPADFPAAEPVCADLGRFRVAYAQDEAFGAYFPDTLETLESLGAELVEFSPLRDESLPEGVDLVMIGCGFPDRHGDALANNLSLIGALRSHVCRGQRIYSEGGGTAYLGRTMILEGGRRVPGAGIFPFEAELIPNFDPPSPVTRTLIRDAWLGAKGTTVQGYRSGRWKLQPGVQPMDCPSCSGPLSDAGDFFYHHHAVGSLIHLHLGALPGVVAAFAGPHRPSLTLPSNRP